jgi:hypothetical protein
MVFQRGRTSKPQEPTGRRSRKSSQKSKAEDTEEDSQQKYVGKDEHIDSNDAGDTRVKLNRNSIRKSCAELEAASRTQPAKKGLLMLDRLTQAQVEKEERKRMRQEATAAGMEYKTATIVRSVSAFTYDDLIKFARDLQDKHTAVTKQDVMLRRFLLEYDKTLIELQKFFGATDPVPGRDEVTDVQLVKTESGVLANFGKNVTEVYTALQGIRLPNGELKRLKNEWKNRPEFNGRHQYRHSEEQTTIQGRDQQSEEKGRLTQSCANCGKTGHTISICWKKGGGAYQEDRLSPAKKKLKSQLNPSNLKAQTAAITAMQSKFDKLCTLLEPLVKSQLEADQH